jgi:hypothetical protein
VDLCVVFYSVPLFLCDSSLSLPLGHEHHSRVKKMSAVAALTLSPSLTTAALALLPSPWVLLRLLLTLS